MKCLLLIFFATTVLASLKPYEGFKVFSVQLGSQEQIDGFIEIHKSGLDAWDLPNSANKPFRVMAGPNHIPALQEFHEKHNLTLNIVIEDVQKSAEEDLKRNAAIPKFSRDSFRTSQTFDHYYRFDEITDFLNKTAEDFPHLMTLESGGKSYEGRDLWVVKISSSGFDGSKPVIFMDANIHAREWISVMSVLNLIHELTQNAEKHPEMLNVDWMIMPMANPDGYEFSHTDHRYWRKTRSKNNGTACRGVDGNRNFDYKWNLGISTSDNPCSDQYRGPHAESEPEVQAISNQLRKNGDKIKLYLAVHTIWGGILYTPGYEKGLQHPNHEALQDLGDRVASAIRSVNPEENYKVGNVADLLYPVSGGSDDFASGEVKVEFAYTLELMCQRRGDFVVSPSLIPVVAEEVFAGFRQFAIYFGEK